MPQPASDKATATPPDISMAVHRTRGEAGCGAVTVTAGRALLSLRRITPVLTT